MKPRLHDLLPSALAAALCAAGANVRADETFEPPLPPRSEAHAVLKGGRLNGLETQILRFTTELTVAEVLQFYERQWTRAGEPGPRQVERAGWKAISTMDGTRQLTVQARSVQGATEALLTQMELGRAQTDFVPRELPRLAGVQVTQVTESRDGPRRSRLISMVSDEGFELQVQRWQQAWLRQGWSPGLSREQRGADGARQWIASYERGRSSADQVISLLSDQRRCFSTVNLIDIAP